jgi:hypothetical protein
MANWLPPMAHRISGISCFGLALDGSSYLTRHSFQQIGDRQPTLEDLIHSAWHWDEQAVQSTNQRMGGLAINALLMQLYQPEQFSTGLASKVTSSKGFSAGGKDDTGAVRPQGPVWILKAYRLDRTPNPLLAPGVLAHRAAGRQASEQADAVVPAGVGGAEVNGEMTGAPRQDGSQCSARYRHVPQ